VLTLADFPIASGRTLFFTTLSLIKENLGSRALDQIEYIEFVALFSCQRLGSCSRYWE
jgi:hypothetical protein